MKRAALLLSSALATGCGHDTLSPGRPAQDAVPAGWEVVQAPFRVTSSGGTLEVFRYVVPGGWVYVTYTYRGVGTAFVPSQEAPKSPTPAAGKE